jgi:hypothetical protein
MDRFVANVEGQRGQAAGLEHAGHLGEGAAQLVVIEVDDRIEGDQARQRSVFEGEGEHVAHDHVEVGKESVSFSDHRRR